MLIELLRDDEGQGSSRRGAEYYACFSYYASFCLAALEVKAFSDIR
jgi:hypothetical protein